MTCQEYNAVGAIMFLIQVIALGVVVGHVVGMFIVNWMRR